MSTQSTISISEINENNQLVLIDELGNPWTQFQGPGFCSICQKQIEEGWTSYYEDVCHEHVTVLPMNRNRFRIEIDGDYYAVYDLESDSPEPLTFGNTTGGQDEDVFILAQYEILDYLRTGETIWDKYQRCLEDLKYQ